jgi:eukaryotic-like serine/threonine-protein kinase
VTAPLDRLKSALGDRYDLERQVGQGGMATVFLARDLKHDRQVAIKVLRPELSASLGADRFLREIRVAANLQHPNILGLYDSGETDGLLFYVMPFVEGESLRDRLIREQQLPIPDALQITREAAEALQYAHSRGIVHRDIKPENILLLGGHALVADFGIARAVSQAGGEKLTQTGMAIGTPYYMSPEQSLGSDHVDARSDVYSLGCVLYELLIGQPPFTGPNPMAIMARHSMEVVPSLQVVRPSVPDDVEDAVMRALQKTPADRFQTMKEFGDCLDEAEAEVTLMRTAARRAATGSRRVPTREMPATPAPAPGPGRNRAMVIGGVVAALLIIGGGAWAGLRHHGGKPAAAATGAGGLDPHRIAVLYFHDRTGRDSLGDIADGLTEGLIRELGTIQGLDVVSKGGVAPFRGDGIGRDSVARALRAGTLVTGDLEGEGDRLRVTVRLVDGASGADFERASFEQPTRNLLAVQDTLTQQAARMIRARLGEEIRVRAQRSSTRSVQAWLLVQQAARHSKAAEAAALRADTAAVAREFRAADSVLALAEPLDSNWREPIVARGTIAYRRSRLADDDQLRAAQWIEVGLGFADKALKLDPQDPDALELRGNLRYWRWLLSLEPDPVKARALLKSAQEDLETAVKIAPSQAGAWATLSHLYYQTGNLVDVKLAARRAYEEDAYLANANVVLSRLFYASYDLGQFSDAVHWCEEGQSRFPQDAKSVECQLYLLTSKAKDPDVPRAWQLSDSLVKLAPKREQEYQRLNSHMMVAATLARAGLGDSARRVAERSRGGAEIDPTRDLMYAYAFVRTLLGDRAEAVNALKVYLAANPEKRASFADDAGWWFRGLQEDARFKELIGVKQ